MMQKSKERFAIILGKRQSAQHHDLFLRQWIELCWSREGVSSPGHQGGVEMESMTVSLVLTPGPYQVLVSVPWDGKNIEGIAAHFRTILSQPPETWPNVECNPQVRGLGPPPNHGSQLE
jgi:hypothetical protein